MIFGPDRLRAKNAALSLLKRCGIERPAELELELVAWKECNALVVERPVQGCDARVNGGNGKHRLIVINTQTEPETRRRFSLAHEIGHIELHPDVNQLALCTMKNLFWYNQVRPEEREADLFATELLMPEPWFQPRCDESEPSFELIEHLAGDFNTSLTATAIRYIEFCPYTCALVGSRNGRITSTIMSDSFRSGVRGGVREGRLEPESYAADFFTDPKRATTTMKKNMSPRWLNDGRRYADAMIREQSRRIGSYGVLTLLWLDDLEEE